MAVQWVTKSAGQQLQAAEWNNARSDFVAGKFFSGSGSGTNYAQVSHDATDGKIESSLGHMKVNAPTGSSAKLQVNGTDVLAASGSLITASQALKVPNGSVGTPGLHLAGDVDTGIGLISSKLAMIFGGAVRMDNDGTTWDAQGQAITTTANISTTGSGILVGAGGVKPKGSGTGSDTLSHYESAGTFTPDITYVTPGTFTKTATTSGRYVKIGPLIYFDITIAWTAWSVGTASGSLQITGSPYSGMATGTNMGLSIASYGVAFPAGTVAISPYLAPSSTAIRFNATFATGTPGFISLLDASNTTFSAAGSLLISGITRATA